MSLPQDRAITPAQTGTYVNLLALSMGDAPVSVEIRAYNPTPSVAEITVRRYSGAPSSASVVVQDFVLPPGCSWWRDEIIRPAMVVDVQSDTAGVIFQANGI